MEKKKYIKPRSVVVDDAGISLMQASPYYECQNASYAVDPKNKAYEDGIDYEVGYIMTEDDKNSYTPNAKMHDLWEEW